MDEILKVENLTKKFSKKGFPDFVAVDHINFGLRKGECLGIIGESGSGKSTAAGLVTRLLDPAEGTITLDGEDITNRRGRELKQVYRKVQMVFQSPLESFDPRRTLGDGIGESLRNSGISKTDTEREVNELLIKCGLDASFGKKYPHEVSGGQCQRAAIARALAIKPQILICDEATSALDVTIQKEIIELLEELRHQYKEELSIIFISHDIALVQQFCDRVLVMYKGRIVEEGVPDEVIKSPRDEYTKNLIEAIL